MKTLVLGAKVARSFFCECSTQICRFLNSQKGDKSKQTHLGPPFCFQNLSETRSLKIEVISQVTYWARRNCVILCVELRWLAANWFNQNIPRKRKGCFQADLCMKQWLPLELAPLIKWSLILTYHNPVKWTACLCNRTKWTIDNTKEKNLCTQIEIWICWKW